MLAANFSLRQSALIAPATRSRGISKGLTANARAKKIAGARQSPIFLAAAATTSSSSSPRRRHASSSPFALQGDFDDADGDEAPRSRSSSEYVALLSEAESRGDWVRAVELLTEARVLRVKLPATAFEAAARVASDHGAWQQAASFLARAARILEGGSNGPPPPACSAIRAVFSRLAREIEAEACMDLLDLLRGEEGKSKGESSSSSSSSWSQRPAETRSHALNCAARACARASTRGEKLMGCDGGERGEEKQEQGRHRQQEQLSEEDRRIFFEARLSLLDDMREEGLRIEDGTFGSVALAALAAGDPGLSEELLEERDYL